MPPIVWAMIVAMAILAIVQIANSKKRGQALPMLAAVSEVRMRTQYEIETDEDLEVIQEVYREDRKRERARMALERLGRITPTEPVPAAATRKSSN